MKSTQGASLIGDAAFDFLLIISMPNIESETGTETVIKTSTIDNQIRILFHVTFHLFYRYHRNYKG